MKIESKTERGSSLQQTLAAGASFAILASILSPLLELVSASKVSNKANLGRISAAQSATAKSNDHIPIWVNGSYNAIRGVPVYSEQKK